MTASYGDIMAWASSKDSTHVPSFDSICQLVGIPAYLVINKYGLCEDCGYGRVDRGEYVSPENQSTVVLVNCIDDDKVRCLRCAAAHYGDPGSSQVEKPWAPVELPAQPFCEANPELGHFDSRNPQPKVSVFRALARICALRQE